MPQTYGDIINMGIFLVIKIVNLNLKYSHDDEIHKFTLSI